MTDYSLRNLCPVCLAISTGNGADMASDVQRLRGALRRIADRTRGSEIARIAEAALGEKMTQPPEIINDRN